MKIVILGTGTSQGIPIIGCECAVCQSEDPKDKRQRVSVFVEVEGKKILIDIGPDFRRQMLDNGIDSIDCILLTHEHNDHVAGLDDVRPINFLSKKPMPIYAEHNVISALKKRFDYVFHEEKYPGAPSVKTMAITDQDFLCDDLIIRPVRVHHGDLDILGFRIKDFAYLTDVKSIPENQMDKLTGLDVLVISALRNEKHYAHLTLQESLDIIKELQPKRTLLTHMSHRLGSHAYISQNTPHDVEPAFDGMIIYSN